ncbi:MAG: HAMP domain-containing sensor histidine kinase [Desulfotignum sp.]|nr:HAMP domain-containing sensor histidine kinase [Desulfotignum sp.]
MKETREQAVYTYVTRQSQDLFFVLSRDGHILEANESARTLTGCRENETAFSDLVVDFAGIFNLTDLVQAPEGPHRLNIETAAGRPQSYDFYFSQVHPLVLAFGRLDARELEHLQRQMLSLNQELNNLTRRLHKQNAQLARLNQEKNQFLGMAAHDLRKPIGLILTYSEFLLDEAARDLNTEHQTFLSTIHKRSLFMKHLVDDFLDVSAIEAGRFDLDLQPVDMPNVLSTSLEINRLQARKKGVILQVDMEACTKPVLIDAAKIEQAVTNLVSNAIDYSRKGDTVRVRLFRQQDHLMFSVEDKGPGMSRQDMEKLFTPFGRTRAKKTAGEKSTGLGLMITHKIVTAHNGTLHVDSTPDRGTIITVKLPVIDHFATPKE